MNRRKKGYVFGRGRRWLLQARRREEKKLKTKSIKQQ
jgi:hypothetical protein